MHYLISTSRFREKSINSPIKQRKDVFIQAFKDYQQHQNNVFPSFLVVLNELACSRDFLSCGRGFFWTILKLHLATFSHRGSHFLKTAQHRLRWKTRERYFVRNPTASILFFFSETDFGVMRVGRLVVRMH